ncbi:MAG: hypothetical protein V5A43_07690 [Haloarculaceae archaeon]
MVNITILEVHLDDAIFEANAPFAGEVSEGGETEEATETAAIGGLESEGDGGASKLAPLVLGLVFLVALAALARKLRCRGGDDEPLEEIEADVEAA